MKTIALLIFMLLFFVIGIQPATVKFFTEPVAAAESAPKTITISTPVLEAHTEPLTASVVPVSIAPIITTPATNEDIVWNGLIAAGYSREQTAGIMGNLQQEHHFQTSGDGLAQWIGNRKANLMSRDNAYDINVQLQFMLDELHSGYSAVNDQILASGMTGATLAFQNGYEKCGLCMEGNRLQYAADILASH